MDITPYPTLHRMFALLPALVLVLGVACIALSHQRAKKGKPALSRSTVAWLVPQLLTCAFLTAYAVNHMLLTRARWFGYACAMLLVAMLIVVCRDRVLDLVLGPKPAGTKAPANAPDADEAAEKDHGPEAAVEAAKPARQWPRVVAHVLLTIVAILAMAFFAILAMENAIQEHPMMKLETFPYLLELGLVCLAGVTLYLLSGRRGAAVAALPVILTIYGLVNYFMLKFKGTVLIPADLMALETAATVAGSYSYEMAHTCVYSLAWMAIALAFCSYLVPCRTKVLAPARLLAKHGECRCRRVSCMLMGVASLAMLVAFVTVPSWRLDFGIKVFAWMPRFSYASRGSLSCFVSGVQDIPIAKPTAYKTSTAEEILASYAKQFDVCTFVEKGDATQSATPAAGDDAARQAAVAQYEDEKPSIVFVMNETFADLSVFDGLQNNYRGPRFFKKGLTGTLARGDLSCSVTGAGTCNTEFEALTGESMLYAGSGKYPYTMYDFSKVDNIARQLKEEGYKTTAMHPNLATNWHRNTVYEQMGFDDFLDIDDWPDDAPTFHNGISDKATYDMVLDLLGSPEDEEVPQFIFDVTMQNHSGYNVGNIPEDRKYHYKTDGVTEFTNNCLNEYLACIQASDEDLEYFVDELKKLDRHVILVFWGDHHPGFSTNYNDAWYGDEDEMTHTQRVYQTSYLIWANYDVAGATQTDSSFPTSPAYLAAMTLDYAGAPLSDYQKTQMVVRQTMPAFNAFGLMGADGKWYEVEDENSPVAAVNNDLSKVSYLHFATKVK